MKNIIHRLDFNLQIGDNTNEHQLPSPSASYSRFRVCAILN